MGIATDEAHTNLESIFNEVKTYSREDKHSSFSTKDIPEMQVFKDISKFSYKDFQFSWNIIILLTNTYNQFASTLFLGFDEYPQGFLLITELLTEQILLMDSFIRFFVSGRITSHNFLFEAFSYSAVVLISASSFPFTTVFVLRGSISSQYLIGLRFLKLLRVSQIIFFFKETRLIIRFKFLIDSFKVFYFFFFVIHHSAMFHLYSIRLSNSFNSDSGQFKKYIDSLQWATEELTAIVQTFQDENNAESYVFSILIMVAGLILFGKLFAKLNIYLTENSLKISEQYNTLRITKKWCHQRKIPNEMRNRIERYFQFYFDENIQQVLLTFPEVMPLSLATEVNIYKYKNLISHVKLFDFGEPSFTVSTLRCLSQEIYLPNDYIIRYRDISDKMYFVVHGKAVVLTNDNESEIAILTKGDYFGEIGILLGCFRTVPIKCNEPCLVASIGKKSLMKILENFPEHKEFLLKVANQRIRTCKKEDISTEYDLVEDNSSSSGSDSSEELECPQYYSYSEHIYKNFLLKLITVPESRGQKGRCLIDPLSYFYYFWTAVLILSFTACIINLPYLLYFGYYKGMIAIDIVVYMVFALDVPIAFKSSHINNYKRFEHDPNKLMKILLNSSFIADLISIAPIDWIYFYSGDRNEVLFFCKILRLLKIFRIVSLIKTIIKHSKISYRMIKILLYVYILSTMSHIIACFLSSIDSQKLDFGYIDYLYWSLSISTQVSTSGIEIESTQGKIFMIILLNISKAFYLIPLIESILLISETNKFEVDFVRKIKNIDEWMAHCKIQSGLKGKVRNFFSLQWKKLEGKADEEIFSNFPETLSTDLKLVLYSDLLKIEIFPKGETGAILAIARRCKIIVVNIGATIFHSGEIGLEMYFILEGIVQIVSQRNSVIRELITGNYFGESAILNFRPSLRVNSAVAKSDSTLALLAMSDFKSVTELYESFKSEISKIAEDEVMKIEEVLGEVVPLSVTYRENQPLGIKENHICDQTLTQPQLTTVNESVVFSNELKFIPFLLRCKESKIIVLFYIGAWLWNEVFIPLQLAFSIYYTPFYIFMDMTCSCFYMSLAIYYMYLYKIANNGDFPNKSRLNSLLKMLFYLIASVPFCLILNLSAVNSIVSKTFFSYIRVSVTFFVISYLDSLIRKKIYSYLSLNFLKIALVILNICHVSACLFITIGYNTVDSFINDLSDKSSSNIYLKCFYWSFGALFHVTQGETTIKNSPEKAFNCFLLLVSFFFYMIMFSKLLSLFNIVESDLKLKMLKSFSSSLRFLEGNNIKKYSEQVAGYFNYIWKHNKGVVETEIYNCLPISLRGEMFLMRYEKLLKKSELFSGLGSTDEGLIRTLVRFIEFNYHLLGDVIIRADETDSKMYFIIFGEANVISIEGNTVISVLKPGYHFGEASILYRIPFRTASVVATVFTHTISIDSENLELVFSVFPDWKEKVRFLSERRMRNTFKIPFDVEETDFYNYILDYKSKSPLQKILTRKTEIFIAKNIAEAKEKVVISLTKTVNLIHFCFIVYSCFALPIMISFYKSPPKLMIASEFCYILETVYFVYIEYRSLYEKNCSFLENILKFSRDGVFIIDVISVSPVNLIIVLIGKGSEISFILVLARSLRLVSFLRIHIFLSDVCIYYNLQNKWPEIFKRILHLLISINLITCLFNIIENCGYSNSYLDVLYLTMNNITATGRSSLISCKESSVIFLMILGGLSIIGIALCYKILLALEYSRPSPVELSESLQKKYNLITRKEAPILIKQRFNSYTKFLSVLLHSQDEIIPTKIYNHLPKSIINSLIFKRFKSKLKKISFLKDNQPEILLARIALSLKAEVYLPEDYLIYKDDIGDEMYFIDIGFVDVISPDNSKVIKTLGKGDIVGEMALINNSKRFCSIVAKSFCLVYVLSKVDFIKILEQFPDVLVYLKYQSDQRSKEMTAVSKHDNSIAKGDEEQEVELVQLSMLSNTASSFAAIANNHKNFALMTGMKQLRYNTKVTNFNNEKQTANPFRRRPEKEKKRRKSQIPLAKKLIVHRFSKLKNIWQTDKNREHKWDT